MFDCVPSNLPELYWKYTLNDFKVKLRLHLSCRQAEIVQEYQTLSLIVSGAFGGTSKSNEPSDDVKVPQTENEMIAAFNNMFGQ